MDSEAEISGPALETLVLQELRALNDYLECGYNLYFWQTKNGLEVDFVLYGPKGLIAIEVKRSSHIRKKDLRSLREFKNDYAPAKCYVFYGGDEPLFIDGIRIIPLEQALRGLDRILVTAQVG